MKNKNTGLLYKLKITTSLDQRDYARASATMPEGKLKKFLRKQQERKSNFERMICREIDKMEGTDNQLEEKEDNYQENYFRDEKITESSVLEWSRHREERNLLLCQKLLQKISEPEVHKMLKGQEQQIVRSIKELEMLAENF